MSDSDWYNRYRTDEYIANIVKNPTSAFHHTTWEVIKEAFPDLTSKKICVPSSGDNIAVFAFALLGAKVTSCDISKRQIENAKGIADKLHLDIEFVVDNTMSLSRIKSNEYDLVYTSNGAHVWINDLASMYKNIHRILKKCGVYILYEIHPFGRPFKGELREFSITKPYDDIGPFENSTEYHWRMQDIINEIISSGLSVSRLEEMYDEKEAGEFWFYMDGRVKMTQKEIDQYYDWHTNPLAALPQWMTICSRK